MPAGRAQVESLTSRLAEMTCPLVIVALAIIGCATVALGESFEAVLREAEQGDAEAQADVGYRYQYGVGAHRDYEKALKWNLKAAEQGNPDAQHNLAVMYDEGIEIPENDAEAVKWYQRAADQGHVAAQLNLGVMYWRGEGVQKDLKMAWELLNHVRMASPNADARWKARAALDEIKQEIGVGKSLNRVSYPEWEELQRHRTS